MPLLAVARLSKRLSVYFYNYGKKCASRTYLLLALSLSFITFFSYPPVQKIFQNEQPTIPLADLDAQIWQSSLHVEFHNFTLFRRPPSTFLITQQIRISQPNNQVDHDLIQKATSIYESMATTVITLEPNTSPVSLSTICYKYYGRCMVYRPHYRDQNDLFTTVHDKPSERHPFTSFANVSLDSQGYFLRADGVLLTFVLKQHAHLNTLRIWNALWEKTQSKLNMMMIQSSIEDTTTMPVYSQAQVIPHMIQYKFRLITFDLSYQGQLAVVAYIVVFFLVSTAFGKSNLVRSGPIFGLAAIFLSTACFTTTWGIFDRLGVELNSAPWFLLLFTVNVASLENVFLLTHAVLYAGCDMIVVEKISRGLQSVGVPMTTTLIAELLILNIGKAMDSDVIKEFCLFSEVALIVDYFLGMTFVISILSIDIKRVELTDLGDRKMSKRLHELAKCETDTAQEPEFCPVQDTLDKIDTMSCADCKDFKTHRAFNSLMLCLIVLGLSLFCSRSKENMIDALSSNYIDVDQPDVLPMENTHSVLLNTLANRFWAIVNPDKSTLCMQIQPPHLVIYPAVDYSTQSHLDDIQAHYSTKSQVANSKYNNEMQPPSLFRLLIFNMLQNALVFMMGINIPSLLLCLVMIAIIIWMTPTWREQWLMPFIKSSFEQSIHALIRVLPFKIVKMFFFKGAVQNHPVITKSLEYEPDGIQHRGAIAVQNMFNKQQHRTNVKQVRIKTLSHQHTADVYQLDANTKNSIVSYGHDGKIVLWDMGQAKWMARLDKMTHVRGMLQAKLNPSYFDRAAIPTKRHNISITKKGNNSSNNGESGGAKKMSFIKQHGPKPSCIKLDPSNRWIAAGYDNGMIRIWNVNTGMLVRELDVHTLPVQVQHEENDGKVLRNRFIKPSSSNEGYLFPKRGTSPTSSNRTLHIQFIGTVTEYCHPIVAEAAARCKSNDGNTSQSYLVSVHRGGVIHEWDIVSSECVQTIETGHTRDITQLHLVDARAPHRKPGITWIFTASKDGLVKCFERYRIKDSRQEEQDGQQNQSSEDQNQSESTRWELVYTIDLSAHGAVTSIATELPVGGMGVLVTGSRDGTVKVWNFETGEALTTLSVGRQPKSTSGSSEYSCSSSLASFSRFSAGGSLLNDATTKKLRMYNDDFINSRFINSEDTDSASDYSNIHSLFNVASADHHSSIQQVVVTRYCEVENSPGVCRACDTCFGNGFLVASSSSDHKVHAWRLERSDESHEATRTLCSKDYHRKQYRHRKIISPMTEEGNVSNSNLTNGNSGSSTRRRKQSLSNQSNSSSSTSPKKIIGHNRSLPKNKHSIPEDTGSIELLDIEQLAGDANIPLASSFLGIIDQPAGYGLVFCDKILAGVRRTESFMNGIKKNNEWEVWFASLQYYDPTTYDSSLSIPIETFHLDTRSPVSNTNNDLSELNNPKQATSQLKEALQGLFNTPSNSNIKPDVFKYKHIHLSSMSTQCNDGSDIDDNDDDDDNDNDILEAGEILPFSTVRRVIPLEGSGLACDFGNFVKLIYLDSNNNGDAIKEDLQDTSFQQDTKEQNSCCGGINKTGNESCCSASDNQDHQNKWW
ncbi:WD40 repeat-like protein [Backusella circina FSU 941]|nr:WD40 repeat-like protein [Backusella circina FSU 941]